MLILAQIGVGRWGRNIVSTLEQDPDANLKYLCSRTRGSLEAYPNKYKKITDWRELLRVGDVEAVVIATPASSHADIAVAFLERGVPVFVEKPMAPSLLDAERMVTAAKKGKTMIFVGHVHLYNPAYRAAKEAAHKRGAIRAIDTEAGNNGPVRDDVSALWDWAPHDIALAIDTIGESPRSVRAWGVSNTRPGSVFYDTAYLRLTFSGKVISTHRVSRLDAVKSKRVAISVGEDVIFFDDVAVKDKVSVISSGRERAVYVPYSEDRPLKEEVRAFLVCAAAKTNILTDTVDMPVIRVLDAAERSIAVGGDEIFLG